jgi:hypothetical protein
MRHCESFWSGFATTIGNRRVYAAVFIDAIMVKVRDGRVRNRPVYAAIGVDLDGHKDILGMWAGDGDGESAKFWMAVLTELKNRGVRDLFFVVCDGLKGLPDSVNAVFPLATVQTCRAIERSVSVRIGGTAATSKCRVGIEASATRSLAKMAETLLRWPGKSLASHALWGLASPTGRTSDRSDPKLSEVVVLLGSASENQWWKAATAKAKRTVRPMKPT